MNRADIIKQLGKITPVNITKWVKKEGPSFGPLVGGSEGNRQDIERTADFIKELLDGKVMHYTGGREEVEFYPYYVVLEIHGQAQPTLRRRYVIVKDSKTEEYASFLSWLW
jgi:hypothetical protein